MDKKLTAVLVTAVFGLAACGSGGGGSGTIVTGSGGGTGSGGASSGGSGSSSSSSSGGSSSGGSSAANNTVTSETLFGLYGSLDVNPTSKDSGKFVHKEGDWKMKDISTVEIEGRSIQLLPTGKNDASDGKEDGFYSGSKEKIYTGTSTAPYHQDPSNSWRMIGTHLKHARYGEIYDEYEKRHVFTVGKATPVEKIEQLGQQANAHDKEIKYKGKGLHFEALPYFNAAAVAGVANTNLTAAEAKLKTATENREKARTELANSGGSSEAQAKFDEAQSAVRTAVSDLSDARRHVKLAQEGVKATLAEKPIPVQSEFVVSFGNRTVVGSITDENNPDFKINLKGTFGKRADKSDTDLYRFGGPDTAAEAEGNVAAVMEGSFHGDNAEEMTGVYTYGSSYGTFGAAQEK
ncbi:transferrin-binding protein-like solute binding protein [Conchiformibius steedae]|uniref:Transferrin-binding protein B C-lobe/N-lobe beta-barrel domain-containing protein n=1 Tax=Conchiformibius steedae TaxID=153493 RepID=A0A3P2A6S1_9NEIS|nr:transferrin-binding protein-like solute binding protein [Conchiformibius steedae]RRD90576.1 hypothetical protein EII21_04675 [Conchiformibius steedae]